MHSLVTSLRCTQIAFCNPCCPALLYPPAALLLKKGNLKELYLQHSGIDGDMTCELAEAMSESSKLTVLMLNGNQIQETGASALAAVLTKDGCLLKLDLTGCTSIGAEGTTKLIGSLQCNLTLETLCLPDKYKNTIPLTSEVQKRVIWCSDSSNQRVIDGSHLSLGSKDVQQLCKHEVPNHPGFLGCV